MQHTSCHTHMPTQLNKSVFKNHKITDTVPCGSIRKNMVPVHMPSILVF